MVSTRLVSLNLQLGEFPWSFCLLLVLILQNSLQNCEIKWALKKDLVLFFNHASIMRPSNLERLDYNTILEIVATFSIHFACLTCLKVNNCLCFFKFTNRNFCQKMPISNPVEQIYNNCGLEQVIDLDRNLFFSFR